MAFQILTQQHLKEIKTLVDRIHSPKTSDFAHDLSTLIEQIHKDIPEKRRISTGRYSIVKSLGEELFPALEEAGVDLLTFAPALSKNIDFDPFVRSLAVQLLALHGLKNADPGAVLPYFEEAAADQDWIVRECSSGLVRKLVRKYPAELREWYLRLVISEDPNQRRFVSESLRPVVENRWFHKTPDYALGIIKHLFQEPVPYPRTSVGNSLSDWLRVDREVAWPLVTALAQSGDPNSYWIATRACRNLVKKEPLLVLDLLGVDEYKYKNRVHRRTDLEEEQE